MKNVIVVFDIGKTNKKIFFFDKNFEVVYKNTVRFNEIIDDDGDPCDDIEAIEKWIKNQIKIVQDQGVFKIKAINFSTHGATLVYLDKKGKRITPLYNYLKPLDNFDFSEFYKDNGGVDEFSRKTASPAYGMLNSGLQIYWLKNTKPHFWKQVKTILHYPQYLSFLFSNNVTADYTSIGAHTTIWDFDNMKYHAWLKKENIHLPKPIAGKEASLSNVNGENISIGIGLHDSSSSLVPLLEENKKVNTEFVLISTGTWIICMNPFSKESLTQTQLKNNCLCFMTPEKHQIKSSMQFLGHVHEVNTQELSSYYKVKKNQYIEFELSKELCLEIFSRSNTLFFDGKIPSDYKMNLKQLDKISNYELAYYQLVYEISMMIYQSIKLILDKNNSLKNIYISGGFSKNTIFTYFLSLMMPKQSIKIATSENASALGAAMLMENYL